MLKIKDKILIGLSALVIVLVLALAAIYTMYKKSSAQLDVERQNVNGLLLGQHEFQVRDSLNAVKVSELQLTLSNYEKFRSEDLQLIKDLGIKAKNAEHVITNTTQTTYNVHTTLRDSTVYDTTNVKVLKYNDPYLDINGVIDDEFNGSIVSRDTIKIVEEIKYKRFLGFLWKTNKIKEQNWTTVSKNPHTHMTIEAIVVK